MKELNPKVFGFIKQHTPHSSLNQIKRYTVQQTITDNDRGSSFRSKATSSDKVRCILKALYIIACPSIGPYSF